MQKGESTMRRFSSNLIAAAVVVTGLHQVVVAQEAAGIPEEITQELNGLVGTWKSEGKVGGKEQTGEFTCRWARTEDGKKVCLTGRFSYKTGDEVRSGVTLIGWNAAKKCIEDRGFDANGGNSVLYWTVKSPTQWDGEIVRVEDGQEVKLKAVLVKKRPSEIVMESESETGEASRWVFRKVKGARKKKARK
jgi:hypothetical protein